MKVLGIEMPSAPPEPDDDEGDRPTWSSMDVEKLVNPTKSLPPGADVDTVQSYQISQIARAVAAIGESGRAMRNRLELLEQNAVEASRNAGRRGLWIALLALLTAVAQALPEVCHLLF